MNKLLSQDEISILLNGIGKGNIATKIEGIEVIEGTDVGRIKPYDLANHERIIRGRMPGLELVNERFTRLFMNSLSSKFTRFVDVVVQNISMVKFNEFVKTISLSSSINIFKIEPLHGHALFVIEAPIVFAILECFFGSNSINNINVEDRSFTSIEQRIIKKIVDLALHDVEIAWKSLADVKLKYVGVETNPRFITIVTPVEPVIKIEIRVAIEEFDGKIFLCIPYSILEPIKEKLYSNVHNEAIEADNQWISRLTTILTDSYVKVIAEIGKVELTIGEVLNLKVGDVISVGKPVSDEFDITVEKVLKFKGTPCLSRGSQAIKITNIE
jgi:flagellar motor switch protein FliM